MNGAELGFGSALGIDLQGLLLPVIPLCDLKVDALFSRIDEKFLLPTGALPALLTALGRSHVAVSVGGRVRQPYLSRYFDTLQLRCFHDHRRGVLPRVKVRLRTYETTGLTFLEVKRKSGNGRTEKHRVRVERLDAQGITLALSQLADQVGLSAGLWCPVLDVAYDRLTFVDSAMPTERLTIDSGLGFDPTPGTAFIRSASPMALDGVIIVERKRAHRGTSPTLDVLRQCRAVRTSFSKYAMGMTLTHTTLPHHRFRDGLRLAHRLSRVGYFESA
ncbi:MAG: polyphosphate polymerase domain-containing protein [Myxococcales bacterium]|nr:polyphosphate polymerase domain-containing protein [Myxococcales bacterium]